MTKLDLARAAQASAAAAVKEPAADALAQLQATIADFQATGNPNADWPIFKQTYEQAAQQYKQFDAQDKQIAAQAAARAKVAAAPGVIPAALAQIIAEQPPKPAS